MNLNHPLIQTVKKLIDAGCHYRLHELAQYYHLIYASLSCSLTEKRRSLITNRIWHFSAGVWRKARQRSAPKHGLITSANKVIRAM